MPLLLILLALSPTLFANDADNLFAEEGALGTSRYLLVGNSATPSKAVIIAHGSRPLGSEPSADFNYHSPLYQHLLNEGWLLASTSYSKNHLLPQGVATDISEFHDFLKTRHSSLKKVSVIGTSLGADASLLLAEKNSSDFASIIALCPSRYIGLYTNKKPGVAVLFVTNQNELSQVVNYVESVPSTSPKPIYRTVLRDGHCKFNDAEIIKAWNDFSLLLAGDQIPTNESILINGPVAPSQAIYQKDSFTITISDVDPIHGNISTHAVEEDFKNLKIKQHEMFTFRCKEHMTKLRLVSKFSDVWPTQWLGFFNESGYLVLARNFLNAGDSIECKTGDTLTISK